MASSRVRKPSAVGAALARPRPGRRRTWPRRPRWRRCRPPAGPGPTPARPRPAGPRATRRPSTENDSGPRFETSTTRPVAVGSIRRACRGVGHAHDHAPPAVGSRRGDAAGGLSMGDARGRRPRQVPGDGHRGRGGRRHRPGRRGGSATPATQVPMADGGEGTLDVLGGANRTTTVTGPLGEPVEAGWRLDRRQAVIEMARASGLELAGGAEGNDPVAATTTGTGELIADRGRERRHAGAGGGGRLGHHRRRPGRAPGPVPAASGCGASSWWWPATCAPRFVDAARVFGPAEGRHPGPGAAAHRPARAPGRRLPPRPRRRRARARRVGRGRRAGRRAGRGRGPPRARVRGGGRGGRAVRPARARRPGHHRRGLPRRRVLRRQDGGRRGRAGRPARHPGAGRGRRLLRRRRAAGSTPSRWSTASATSGPATDTLACIEAVGAERVACSDRPAHDPERQAEERRYSGTSTSGGRSVTSTTSGSRPGRTSTSVVPTRSGAARCSGGLQDRHGLGRQLVERSVAVDPLAEVDLGHGAQPEAGLDVDQQAQVDAVALDEGQLLEHLASAGVLAGQRLDERRQLREQQADTTGRATSSVTRPPPTGSLVAPGARRSPSRSRRRCRVSSGPSRPTTKSGSKLRTSASHQTIEVAAGRVERLPQRLALAVAVRRSRSGSRRPRRTVAPASAATCARCDRSSGRRRPAARPPAASAPSGAVGWPRRCRPTVSSSSRAGRHTEISRPAFSATRRAASNSPARKVRSMAAGTPSWSPTTPCPGKAKVVAPVSLSARSEGEVPP